MSHEIRTSLNTIVVTSSELIESNVPDDIKTDLKDCLYASDTLLEIVGNIIDLKKIEKDVITLNNVEYNLKKEVESLVDMTSVRIENKPINFIMNIDNSIPNVLYGDKVYMKQIMNNLLTNAFKYTNEGEVKFNVSCENDFTNKICHIKILVQDTGIGIKDTSKLFNKFDRLDVDKISTVEGTGLGLVITKKIIDSMKGTITVESEYGKGSKFLVEIDQAIVDNPSISIANRSSMNYNFGNRRVLLVDDDKLNLKVEKKTLSKFNFKIDAVTSAEEALQLMRDNGYDLIVTDVYLENEFDDQVLKYAKKFNIPVVCITADAIEGAEEKYLSSGYSYYISKPYSVKDIYNVLESIFRK
jgi:CheY-like chemotaxis protein